MRVLHLYAGNLFGGIERLLVTLARERGCCPEMQPEFALCFDGRLAQELRAENVPVHMMGQVRFSRPWTIWQARRNLAGLLRRESFDAVICHACWPHALFARTVRSMNLPLVFWAHDAVTGKHWLDKKASQTVPDLVLANSRFTLTSATNLFPTARTEVLYYPVSIPTAQSVQKYRQEVRAEMAVPPERVVIVIACRMEEWKGHRLLLESLGKLSQQTDWQCWVIGGSQRPSEQTYLGELKSLAQKVGVGPRINFLGQRADVPRLLCGADIHCQPNTGPEPFGISFIEALGSGLPVVTTAIGAAPEIVNGSCGILVEPSNMNAMAAALTSLIADPHRRVALGSSGPARATELCDPSQRIQGLSKLLSTVSVRSRLDGNHRVTPKIVR